MACSMELLNFLEECEKPAPTICFDIMELVGKQVNIFRKNEEYQKNYGECVYTLRTIFQGGDLLDSWIEDFEMCDSWLGFIADNHHLGYDREFWQEVPEVFVKRFYTE